MGASGPALHGGLGAALRGQCVGARLQDAGLASGPDAGAGGQSPQAPRAPRGSEAGVSGPRDGPGDVPATAPPHTTRLHRPGLGPRRRFPDDLQTSICKGDPEILGFPHGCCGGEGCPQRWLVVVVFNLVFQTMGTLVSVDQQAKACLCFEARTSKWSRRHWRSSRWRGTGCSAPRDAAKPREGPWVTPRTRQPSRAGPLAGGVCGIEEHRKEILQDDGAAATPTPGPRGSGRDVPTMTLHPPLRHPPPTTHNPSTTHSFVHFNGFGSRWCVGC